MVLALLGRLFGYLRAWLDAAVLEGDLRAPFFFLHLNLLDLFFEGHSFGLLEEEEVSNGDDGEQHKETHGVDAVALEVPEIDGTGGRSQRADC